MEKSTPALRTRLPANVWLATGVLSAAIGREGWSIVRFMSLLLLFSSPTAPSSSLRASQARAILALVQRADTLKKVFVPAESPRLVALLDRSLTLYVDYRRGVLAAGVWCALMK